MVAMDKLVVEVLVPGGVAGEVAPLRDRSSVSGVARLVTSPPSVKKLWQMWLRWKTTVQVKRRSLHKCLIPSLVGWISKM